MNILLLGGIGSGKSEALKILREEHFANIIEADKVAHFLYEKDRAGYTALRSVFGDIILDDKKNIDRKKLGDILYYDKEKLRLVNSIIHPLVYEEIKNRLVENRLNVVEQALMPDNKDIYDEIGLYEDVKDYVEYNANRALANLGYPGYFEDKEINPIIENAMNTNTKNHDFFSVKGDGYVVSMNVESIEDEDFIFE